MGYLANEPGGGGGGTIGGTIAATQVAYGSALNTITGDANFITDGSTYFEVTRVPQAGYTASIQIDPALSGAIPGVGIFWFDDLTGENVSSVWGDLNALAPGVDVGHGILYDDGIGDIGALMAITNGGWIQRSTSTLLGTGSQIQLDPVGVIDLNATNTLGGYGLELTENNGLQFRVIGGAGDYFFPLADGAAGEAIVTDGAGNLSFSALGLSIGSAVLGGTADWVLYIDNAGNLIGDNNFVRDNTTQNIRITAAPGADSAETEWQTTGGLSPLIRNTAITAGFEVNEFIGQNGSGHRWEVQALDTVGGTGIYQTQGDNIWVLTGTDNGSFSNFIDSAQEFNREHRQGVADIIVTELMNIAGFGWSTTNNLTGFSAAISATNNANGIIMNGVSAAGVAELALQNAGANLSYTPAGGNAVFVRAIADIVSLGDILGGGNSTEIIINDSAETVYINGNELITLSSVKTFIDSGQRISRLGFADTAHTIAVSEYMVVGFGLTVDRIFDLPNIGAGAGQAPQGQIFVIKNKSDSVANIILSPNPGDTIQGVAGNVTIIPGDAITVVSDGGIDWEII